MAQPYKELTKSEFRDNYNVVKVLTDKVDIMKQLSSFNSKNQAVAFATRKQHTLTINEKLDVIILEIKGIKQRLDKHDELFKQHGWIK